MAFTNITTFPGNVGISNTNPTHTLAIGSNVFVDDTGENKLVVTGSISTTGKLAGDGSALSGIQSSNVSDFASNVSRIENLETDLGSNVTRIENLETSNGHIWSNLASNVTRIENLETSNGHIWSNLASNVTRIENLETSNGHIWSNLASNVTRIENLETSNGHIWSNLASNVTRIETLESGDTTITGTKTFQDDVILESNLRVQGDLLVANTINMIVSDPILELGSNNLNTGDLGIIMTRHGVSDSNVTVFYDESEDIFNVGYTTSNAYNSTIAIETNNPITMNVHGNLEASHFKGDGSALSGIQSSNVSDFASNVTRITNLETDLGSNVTRIENLETDLGSNVSRIETLETDLGSNVTRIENLETDLGSNVSRIETLETDLGSNVTRIETLESGDLTIDGEKTFSSNLEVGTANLFVDTVTGRVGVGTTNPKLTLDVRGPIITPVVAYASNRDSAYLIAASTNYTGASTNWGTLGFQHKIKSDSGGTPRVTIDTPTGGESFTVVNNGNVGIGLTNPAVPLHVASSNFVSDAVGPAASANNVFRVSSTEVDSTLLIGASDTGSYISSFSKAGFGTERNLILNANGGNVGIGVSNPGVKLDLPAASGYNPVIRIGTNTTYDDGQLYSLRWGGSGLMGMGLYSSTRTVFGSQGIGLHIPNTEEYSVRTNGWAKLFALDGATYKAYFGGKVGIGVTNPIADLTVYGTGGYISGSTSRSHFTGSLDHLYRDSGTASGNINILARYWMSAYGFIAVNGVSSYSDKRIKKNIVDADDTECLEVLRLLKPKKYQYKDDVERGTEPVWGFIAQEVRETLPYATTLRKAVVPNIYELANVSQSNVITFTNFNTSNLESNATTIIQILGIDGKEHDINLVEVIDEHTIRVEEDLTEWIGSMDETGNVIAGGNQLFIYGQQVDDFCHLTKDAIWTVATSALQEVDRQLQAEKAKVATLETQLASVLARLDALENT
jgi:hypothetical protein